ncbi:MAG TPA: hypothetical protein VMD30_02010 [Tepidisphaeraceae bacterium]|nr:hypothetical protein [Tepidisphaeraceae bacterium]
MLLQTNSYIVPKEKRPEHARILRRFRQTLQRLGCDHFEVYEQVGANWNTAETTGRFVQIMRFRDRKHQMQVQAAERSDPQAQQVVREFCELINFPYQQQQGLFAVGYYTSFLRPPSGRPLDGEAGAPPAQLRSQEIAAAANAAEPPEEIPVQPEPATEQQEFPDSIPPVTEEPPHMAVPEAAEKTFNPDTADEPPMLDEAEVAGEGSVEDLPLNESENEDASRT